MTGNARMHGMQQETRHTGLRGKTLAVLAGVSFPLCCVVSPAEADQSFYLTPLIEIFGVELIPDAGEPERSYMKMREQNKAPDQSEDTSPGVVIIPDRGSEDTAAQPAIWAKSGVHYLDETLTSQTIQGTFATLSGGVAYPLSDQLTAVFGLNYTHGDMNGSQAVDQTMDMDGVGGSVALNYAVTRFDSIMAGFGYRQEWTHNVWSGDVADYTINRVNLNVGYEKTIPLDDDLTVVLGINHKQVSAHRDQATWSTGSVEPALDTSFGHAAALGRLIMEQPGYDLSATASVGLFTNDDSPLNLDDGSLDLTIGAGISGTTESPINWRASAYSSFRSNVNQFGAKLRLGADF